MARISTASIVINSVQGLRSEQKELISEHGPDPKDVDAVRKFTRRFCDEFRVMVSPGKMRVLITSLRRSARRTSKVRSTPASPPPFVRMAALHFAVASR